MMKSIRRYVAIVTAAGIFDTGQGEDASRREIQLVYYLNKKPFYRSSFLVRTNYK